MGFRIPGRLLRKLEAFKWWGYKRRLLALSEQNKALVKIPHERWGTFSREGFHQLRSRWPGVFNLETSSLLHEHLMLLEYFDITKEPPRSFDGAAPKVLISSLGHIGDIIHAMPMVYRLRKKYPESEIHFVCGPWAKAVVKKYSVVNAVHTWKPQLRMYCRDPEDLNESFDEQRVVLQALRDESFDLFVSCSITTFSELVLRQAVNPARYLGAELNLSLYSCAGGDHTVPFKNLMYEADRLQELSGFEEPYLPITFPVASVLPAKWTDVFSKEKRIVVLAPTAGWEGKCWPLTSFKQLLEKLLECTAIDIVAITGSPAEKEICQELCIFPNVINMASELSLEETALLIKQASLFIGNDSAPLHLATCVGAKRIALFGATDPARWTKPDEQLIVLRKVDKVAGAYPWHPEAPTQSSSDAMAKITIDEVLEAAHKLLV